MLPSLYVLVALGVLGLMIGSFLNVVIHRLPLMMEREWKSECNALLNPQRETINGADNAPTAEFNLARPRSRCPACETQIAGYDNVPVFSYLLLAGKCRHCKTPISARYPIIEWITGCLSAYCAWHFANGEIFLGAESVMKIVASAVFCWYLIALAMIDFDTQLLPDSLTLPLLWGGLVCAFFGWFAVSLESAVIGAMLGYLSLWSIYWIFKLITGKEGMGYGDFKLLAALGAWLGWQALPGLILTSSLIGAGIGISMMLIGTMKRAQPMPFGPFLAFAGIVMMFWQAPIAQLFSPTGGL